MAFLEGSGLFFLQESSGVVGYLPSKAGQFIIPTASGRGRGPRQTHARPCAGECGYNGGRQRLSVVVWGLSRRLKGPVAGLPLVYARGLRFHYIIGTAGVVYTSVLGVKSYDYGKIN